MLAYQHTKTIRTHEDTDDEEGMEFCWKLNYIQLNDTSVKFIKSPLPKSFRAGFREGVKMSLDLR